MFGLKSSRAEWLPIVEGDGEAPPTPTPTPTSRAPSAERGNLPGASATPKPRIVARTTSKNLVFLDAREVWAFEARERLSFVHARRGRFDFELPLAEIETLLGPSFLRVHRNWLVSLPNVRELRCPPHELQLFVGSGIHDEDGIVVPVARERLQATRRRLLDGAIGIRRRVDTP